MVEQYWELFALSLAGMVMFAAMLVLSFVFAKKVVPEPKIRRSMARLVFGAFDSRYSIIHSPLYTLL